MTEPDEWAPWFGLGDENGIPIFGFRVLSSIKGDGSPEVAWEWNGEQVTGANALGVIIGAAIELFHGQMHDAE